jgi:hypothetical protein
VCHNTTQAAASFGIVFCNTGSAGHLSGDNELRARVLCRSSLSICYPPRYPLTVPAFRVACSHCDCICAPSCRLIRRHRDPTPDILRYACPGIPRTSARTIHIVEVVGLAATSKDPRQLVVFRPRGICPFAVMARVSLRARELARSRLPPSSFGHPASHVINPPNECGRRHPECGVSSRSADGGISPRATSQWARQSTPAPTTAAQQLSTGPQRMHVPVLFYLLSEPPASSRRSLLPLTGIAPTRRASARGGYACVRPRDLPPLTVAGRARALDRWLNFPAVVSPV